MSLRRWVNLDKAHRVVAGARETYCGLRLESEIEPTEKRPSGKATECRSCRVISREVEGATAIGNSNRFDRMTPEQLDIASRREQQKVRRIRTQIAEAKSGGRDQSPSIRTVSGGLPGLGRKGR